MNEGDETMTNTINQAPGDSRQGTTPLWSDKDITKVVRRLQHEVVSGDIMIDEDDVIGFGVKMRDEYEAKISELEANVTGLEEHIAFIHAKLTRANDLLAGYDKQVREVGEMNERLTAELAEAPAGAGVLTDEVRATITAALDVLRETRLVDLWYLGCDQDIRGEPVDKALAWLAESETNNASK
jgi:DNA-binding transcriptional ArsR family regulator